MCAKSTSSQLLDRGDSPSCALWTKGGPVKCLVIVLRTYKWASPATTELLDLLSLAVLDLLLFGKSSFFLRILFFFSGVFCVLATKDSETKIAASVEPRSHCTELGYTWLT